MHKQQHKALGLRSTALLLESGGQAISEVRLQLLLQIVLLTQLAVLHAGADPLRPVTPLVPAPLLVLATKTSCIKKVVISVFDTACSVMSLTVLYKSLLNIPVLLHLVGYVSLCCTFPCKQGAQT